jgi:hypothetical protein
MPAESPDALELEKLCTYLKSLFYHPFAGLRRPGKDCSGRTIIAQGARHRPEHPQGLGKD